METKKFGLNGNILKIIAAISMLVDHMGLMFFDGNVVCRIIGRLAYPIFAFFIAEGCLHTKNKLRYFLQVFILGVVCQLVYIIFMDDWYFNILITFAFSIAIIFAIELAKEKDKWFWWLIPLAVLGIGTFLSVGMPQLAAGSGFVMDYGFMGMMIPVLVYLAQNKYLKLGMLAIGLVALSLMQTWQIEWYTLFALILLAFYNGERGRLKMKYFFYVFYPAHLAILYLIFILIH